MLKWISSGISNVDSNNMPLILISLAFIKIGFCRLKVFLLPLFIRFTWRGMLTVILWFFLLCFSSIKITQSIVKALLYKALAMPL